MTGLELIWTEGNKKKFGGRTEDLIFANYNNTSVIFNVKILMRCNEY